LGVIFKRRHSIQNTIKCLGGKLNMYIIYVLTSSHFTELTISVPQWTCGHLKRQPGPRELSITCRVVVKISEVIFITRRHSATVKLNHKTVKTNKQTCKYCTLKWERVILANCNPVRLESVAYLKKTKLQNTTNEFSINLEWIEIITYSLWKSG